MGLDAFVRCRCWQDGHAAEPPVPRGLVVVDGDGHLGLSLPCEGNQELYRAFDTWLSNGACPHEHMELVSVRIANWPGYRRFQQALRSAGCRHHPTLCSELPDTNGGTLPPERARGMLAELGQFTAQATLPDETWLVDDESGVQVAVHLAGYGGVFVWCGASMHEAGVDQDGFFLRDVATAPAREVFRSRHFTQERLDGQAVGFTDLDTGATVGVEPFEPLLTEAETGDGYPRRLRVETRPLTPHDFADIVGPLTAVCTAAVASGNPVVWC